MLLGRTGGTGNAEAAKPDYLDNQEVHMNKLWLLPAAATVALLAGCGTTSTPQAAGVTSSPASATTTTTTTVTSKQVLMPTYVVGKPGDEAATELNSAGFADRVQYIDASKRTDLAQKGQPTMADLANYHVTAVQSGTDGYHQVQVLLIPNADAPTTTADPYGPLHVVYSVSDAASASTITYSTNGMGRSSQANGVGLPWSKALDIDRDGLNSYSLIAQNSGSGTITCSISIDGRVVDTESSSGPYAVVTCSS